MVSRHHDGGAYCRTERHLPNTAVTAGGTGDATEVNGVAINRTIEGIGIAQSCKLSLAYSAVLGVGQSLGFSVQLQDDDGTGTTWTDRGDAMTAVSDVGGSGGSTETGTAEFDVDLAGLRQDFRFQVTPNLSRANTDTAAVFGTVVLFGAGETLMTKAGAAQHLAGFETLE